MNDISRRRLLGTAGAVGAGGLVVGAAAWSRVRAATEADPATALTTVGSTEVAFRSSGKTGGGSGSARSAHSSAHSAHQAGITTPAQSTGYLIAFDLAAGGKPDPGRGAAAPLVCEYAADDGGRAGRRRHRDRARRGSVVPDSHLRLRAVLLRPYGTDRAAPHPARPAAGLLVRPSGRQAQQRRSVGADRRERPARRLPRSAHAPERGRFGGPGPLADERFQPLARRDGQADDHPQSDGPDRRDGEPQALGE